MEKDLLMLKLGDVYYSVNRQGKEFEVVRLDVVQDKIMGFYLAAFKGSETEAIYISKHKGVAWFDRYWALTHEEAWRKEIIEYQRKIDCMEEILAEKEAKYRETKSN